MRDHDDQLPDDLRALGERLSREATRPTAAELDELKLRTMRDAGRGRRGRFVGSRLATILTIGVLGAGTGGTLALAWSGGKPDDGDASEHQYKPPGKGCGDKNKEHQRKGECKDDEKGNGGNGGGGGGKGDNGGGKGGNGGGKGGDNAHTSKNDGKSKGEKSKGDKAKAASTEGKSKKHK
jgi:hypothetical protein